MTPEERAARDEKRRYALACELENWKPGKVREGVRQGWHAMERQADEEQADLRAAIRRLAGDLGADAPHVGRREVPDVAFLRAFCEVRQDVITEHDRGWLIAVAENLTALVAERDAFTATKERVKAEMLSLLYPDADAQDEGTGDEA